MTGRPNTTVYKTVTTRHGKDFYQRIGRLGGANGNTGGFYNNPEAAQAAGRKGWMVRRKDKCDCGKLILNQMTRAKHAGMGHRIV